MLTERDQRHEPGPRQASGRHEPHLSRSHQLARYSSQHSPCGSLPSCQWGAVLANWSEPYSEAPARALIVHEISTQSTRLALPPSSLGRPGVLEFYFRSVGDDEVSIHFGGSRSAIEFKTRAGNQMIYRVPVSVCPQWFARQADSILVNHHNAFTLEKVAWVEKKSGSSAPSPEEE